MIAKFYGKDIPLIELRKKCFVGREGVSILGIADAAKEIGFNVLKLEMSFQGLSKYAHLPCIIHWRKEHFVVLYKIKQNTQGVITKIKIVDPAVGHLSLTQDAFMSNWLFDDKKQTGLAIFFEPNEIFKSANLKAQSKDEIGFGFIIKYFVRYRKYFIQIIGGMLTASMLSLIFPFLTQSIVDVGISSKDSNFILLILCFQVFLFIGNTVIELIQNQLMLQISTRINLSIVSDFIKKMMLLPINFFDSKNVGDITNRINDQKRIESFITTVVLKTFFSILNFVVYTFIIAAYSVPILSIFIVGSIGTFIWTYLFMERRKTLDYKLFSTISTSNENVYELVNGMQEIKLNQFEEKKKGKWEQTQIELLNINISSLKLEQYQTIGSIFLTQTKNILITYLASLAVINGEITIGMMLSISFIIGQLNSPIDQFISVFKLYQNAKISLERMSEVYVEENEEKIDQISLSRSPDVLANTIKNAAKREFIGFKDVSFSYDGPRSSLILENINFEIPMGKVTAIVGASGSGKTTIMKLLLKFYKPTNGSISINGVDINSISASSWRKICGSVMQDGYLFSDTIENNIITGNDFNAEKFDNVCKISCIDEFIQKLPLGRKTKIGKSGIGISGGEKQRILIARALYKNPEILLFDEAISALDANSERMISDNLNVIYKGKTVVVIAHRLSTVKNADQILVLSKGKIVEAGTHVQLVELKGVYHELVKNQLELEIQNNADGE